MGILSSRQTHEFDGPASDAASKESAPGSPTRWRTARILLGAMAHHPGFRQIAHPAAGNEIKTLLDAAQDNTQALIDAGYPGEQAAPAGYSLTAQAWSASKSGGDTPLALGERIARYAKGLNGAPLGRPSIDEIMREDAEEAGGRVNALHHGLSATVEADAGLRAWFIDQIRDQSAYADPTTEVVDALHRAGTWMAPNQWVETAFLSEESRRLLHLTLAAQAFKAAALYDGVVNKAGEEFARFALGDRSQHVARALDLSVSAANAVENADMAAPAEHDEMILARSMGSLMNQAMRPWFEFRYDMARVAWPHYGKSDTGALKRQARQRANEGLILREAILSISRTGNPFDLATEARVRGELVMAYRAAERRAARDRSLPEVPFDALSIVVPRTQHLIDVAASAHSRSPGVPDSVRGRARHHIEAMLRDVASGTIRQGRVAEPEIGQTLISALSVYQQVSRDDMGHAIAALRAEVSPSEKQDQASERVAATA